MPWQPDGNFLRTNNQFTGDTVWEQDQQAAIKIIASRHDYHDEDLAVGIENCLNLDGYNKMRADLDMNNNTIINLQGGTLATEGSWIPQLVNPVTGGNNSTMAASPDNAGWYSRSGRLVIIYARINWTSTNSQGDIGIAIDGMPFTIDEPFAGAHLGMYASSFLAGEGMAVSGIGTQPPGIEVNLTAGGSVFMFQPEAQVQGVVPIPAGENYDPLNPANQTAGVYIHLRSYFGTNNSPPAAGSVADAQFPYYYDIIEQTGRFGFQMSYFTNDP